MNIGLNENGGVKLGTKEGNINLNAKDKSGNLSVGTGQNAINLNKVAKVGCSSAMTEIQFEGLKKNITSESSDSTKLIAAKKMLTTYNCFETSQIKEVMNLFTEDKPKLEFAKNAYPFTHDLSNYGHLKDSFKKEESKDELQKYIKDMK
jgi:hypothetical protein